MKFKKVLAGFAAAALAVSSLSLVSWAEDEAEPLWVVKTDDPYEVMSPFGNDESLATATKLVVNVTLTDGNYQWANGQVYLNIGTEGASADAAKYYDSRNESGTGTSIVEGESADLTVDIPEGKLNNYWYQLTITEYGGGTLTVNSMKLYAGETLLAELPKSDEDPGGEEEPGEEEGSDTETTHTGSVTFSDSSWWTTNDVTLQDLIGSLDSSKVTYVKFSSDTTFVVQYHSVNDDYTIDADDPYLNQTDGQSKEYVITDIDFVNNYMVKVCLSKNDGVDYTISWVASTEEVKDSDPDDGDPDEEVLFTGESSGNVEIAGSKVDKYKTTAVLTATVDLAPDEAAYVAAVNAGITDEDKKITAFGSPAYAGAFAGAGDSWYQPNDSAYWVINSVDELGTTVTFSMTIAEYLESINADSVPAIIWACPWNGSTITKVTIKGDLKSGDNNDDNNDDNNNDDNNNDDNNNGDNTVIVPSGSGNFVVPGGSSESTTAADDTTVADNNPADTTAADNKPADDTTANGDDSSSAPNATEAGDATEAGVGDAANAPAATGSVNGDSNANNADKNQNTGFALALIPAMAAAAGVVIAKKRK